MILGTKKSTIKFVKPRLKIPYMLVVGDREAEQGTVAVRHRSEGDQGSMPLVEFEDKLLGEIRTKSY